MKKYLKWTGILALILLFGMMVAGIYTSYFLPGIEARDLDLEVTPERIKRGKYLANHVAVCIDCHSTRDWSKFSGPVISGTLGGGGEKFDHSMGFPGEFYAPNITPQALINWSNGELFRAITSGVSKDGRALFPVMPYHNYGKMSEEDIYSIIAYIRTLRPVNTIVQTSKADFPMNIIINTMPKQASLIKLPDFSGNSYGKYLVTAAGCSDCHTKFEDGQYEENMEFAGGREFTMPFGKIVSTNLTPHDETGIGKWSKERFITRFKMYSKENYYEPHKVEDGDFNTIMPWVMYSGMKEDDLAAIYDYLMSLEPIENKVHN